MGSILKTEQAEVSFEKQLLSGLSNREIIHNIAEDRAFAKHEHAMKMGMAEFAYEIRDGRLYSSSYQVYFDDLINPPASSRTSGYPAMPDHVIQNLSEAQRLLVSGEVNSLALLSPALDFQAEGSNKGQVYFMRRVGNQILVVSTDHSENAEQMLKEAASLYGVSVGNILGGSALNGGGIFAVTREQAPTREEVLAAIKEHGNQALVQQYENAIYLGEGLAPHEYLAKLIEREKNDIYRYLEERGISLNTDANQALREAFRYVEREMQAINEQTYNTNTTAMVATADQSERQTFKQAEARIELGSSSEFKDSVQQNSLPYTVALTIDYGRMQGDALYRAMRESELQGGTYTEQKSFVVAEKSFVREGIDRSFAAAVSNATRAPLEVTSIYTDLETEYKRRRESKEITSPRGSLPAASSDNTVILPTYRSDRVFRDNTIAEKNNTRAMRDPNQDIVVNRFSNNRESSLQRTMTTKSKEFYSSQQNLSNSKYYQQRFYTERVDNKKVGARNKALSPDAKALSQRQGGLATKATFFNKKDVAMRQSSQVVLRPLRPSYGNYQDTPVKRAVDRLKNFLRQRVEGGRSSAKNLQNKKSVNLRSKVKPASRQLVGQLKSVRRSDPSDSRFSSGQYKAYRNRARAIRSVLKELKALVRKLKTRANAQQQKFVEKRSSNSKTSIKIESRRNQVFRLLRAVARSLQVRENLASRVLAQKSQSRVNTFRSRVYELAKIRLVIDSVKRLEIAKIRFPKQKLQKSLSLLKDLVIARRVAIKLLLSKKLSVEQRQLEKRVSKRIFILEKRFGRAIFQLRKSPLLRRYARFFTASGVRSESARKKYQAKVRIAKLKNGRVLILPKSSARPLYRFSITQLLTFKYLVGRYHEAGLVSTKQRTQMIKLIATVRVLRSKFKRTVVRQDSRAKRRRLYRIRRLELALELLMSNLMSAEFYASVRAVRSRQGDLSVDNYIAFQFDKTHMDTDNLLARATE